jgi:U3 small nucleolar RNA-associated protein 21
MESGVLESFRTLGLICDNKAFKWHREGNESLLTFPLGKSFLTYTVESLQIRYLGCQLTQTVNSVETYKDLILLASGSTVSAFHKVKLVKVFTGSSSSISELLVFSSYLLGLNFSGELLIWDCETTNLLNSIPLGQQGQFLIHPPTHLNKVLISLKTSKLLLINIKTGAKIYDFPQICKDLKGEITSLENAVALDTIVLGTDSGQLLLANMLSDQVLFSFDQGEKVTSVSVSSFGDCSILASGSISGTLYFWDLKGKKIQSKVAAHSCEITKVFFLPNELRLLSSSGKENSVKQWVFDFESPVPRVNKSREGFSSPPFELRFYNENHVLAISKNSLRDLSLLNEHQSASFSSKNMKPAVKKLFFQKLPEFHHLSFSVNREKDWSNVLTSNGEQVFLWSYENKAAGEKAVERKTQGKVTAVQVSECGNFGVLGNESGSIEKFNMQSGLHQFTFNKTHKEKVTGLEIDSSNTSLISSSENGEVFIFDFFTGKVRFHQTFSEKIVKIRLQKYSNLLAVLTESNCLIFDVRTLKLARSFEGNQVKDACFSSDSRWVAVADASGVALWDLPNVKLVDWVCFKRKVVSLDFSPDSRYLATALEGRLGVFLWLNKNFYTQVIINKSPELPRKIKGFDVSRGKNFYSRKKIKINEILNEPLQGKTQSVVVLSMPKQPDFESLKVSDIPYSRVAALFQLDEIRERNAPVQPLKKNEKVPFFLPDSLGIVKFEPLKPLEMKKEQVKENGLKDVLGMAFESILEFLKTMAPAKIELNLFGIDSGEDLNRFVEFLVFEIREQKDFDFLQSLLACFLRIHSADLGKEQAKALLEVQEKTWSKVEEQLLFDISGLERLLD